ncbi:MAG: VWA domain-containing protein [Acidobacteria bacterium]|nr:VWA domain-containing protein [Acidobacteriota bacterium]
MFRDKSWMIFAALSALSVGLFAGAQQQQPFTIKAEAQLVLETVTVQDKDGKPVEGLTRRDFVITEDGSPQSIEICEFQKFEDTALPPIKPRSIFNSEAAPISKIGRNQFTAGRVGEIKYQDRRLLVLYFDLMTMPETDRYRAFAAGRKFIQNQMTASDLMSIMIFSKSVVRVLLDFTDDREELDLAIQTLMKKKQEGEEDDDWNVPDTAAAFGQNSSEFNLFNIDRQLAALQTAVKMMGALSERKTLVYFASGLRLNGMDNQAQLRATINAAIRANVVLYPVDARGLVAEAPMGDASTPSSGGVAMFTGASAMARMASFQQSQDTLYTLAEDTGGKAMLDYNDLSRGIVNAQKAVTSYYILGYYTTNTEMDGKFRKIKIELADGQQAKLDYRKGYYARKKFSKFTAADKERQLEEALMLGDPITDLTIAMEVNYFKLNSAEYYVPVTIKIPGSELVLAKNTGSDRTVIDFIGEIRDDYGSVYSNLRDKVSFKLKGETAAALMKSPIEYDCGFTLLPGKYIIKVLARDAETGRIGTYQAVFTIPNLMKEFKRVPVSSVVLSSQRVDMRQALYTAAGKDKTQTANPLVLDGKKLIPSVTRVFSKKNKMHVYLQAYENNTAAMEPLIAYVTFFRGEAKAFETSALAATEGMHPKSRAVPLHFTIPLDKLPPGEYKCQTTVLDPNGKKAAFWQAPVMLVE